MKQLESEYHSLEHKGITTIENPIGYYLSRMKSMLSGKC